MFVDDRVSMASNGRVKQHGLTRYKTKRGSAKGCRTVGNRVCGKQWETRQIAQMRGTALLMTSRGVEKR